MLPPFLQQNEGGFNKELIVVSPEEKKEDKELDCAEMMLMAIKEDSPEKMKEVLNKFFELKMNNEEGESKDIPEFLRGK